MLYIMTTLHEKGLMMTTMNEERAGFESAIVGIANGKGYRWMNTIIDKYPEGSYRQMWVDSAWLGFQAGAAWQRAQGAGVPVGWVIAPQEIHLSASDIELINGMCGDGNEEGGYGPYQDGTLYIGYALQDDGSKVYGLHISCDECPEEGVTTLAEFPAAPAHPVKAQLLEALEHARLFIRNGVELGFIRMPDANTPDPAHNTLPMIEAAIAAARKEGGE